MGLVKNIDISKSSGIDKISSKCLRDAIMIVLNSQLSHIFDVSLKNCYFPKSWKVATIVPLFKNGKRNDVSNYRPVSLLPIPGKILEKVIHLHNITNFLEKNNILCNRQGGFRKNHSTLSSITDFPNDLFNAINTHNLTKATFFFYLKKAFDTVDHYILIRKLEKMGIRGKLLRWIENYLNERVQKTICNNTVSTVNNVLCGVPKGSILGPLLFLVYINDIENIIENAKFQLYADDTVIYSSSKNVAEIETNLQKNINNFSNWCEINKLTINTKKTKIMVLDQVKKYSNVNLNVMGERLQVVPTYKYLSINLDQTLNFNYHLKYIANLISHKLYVFCKIRKYLNDHAALTVYKTMILPYFDYGDAIFMFSKSPILKKLDRLHLRGLKISIRKDNTISDDQLFNT